MAGTHDGAPINQRATSGTANSFSPESKYYALHTYFTQARDQAKRLSFAQVEEVLGFPLPVGARSSRAWWGNSRSGHSQSRAWLLAGWRMTNVDLSAEVVEFERTSHR